MNTYMNTYMNMNCDIVILSMHTAQAHGRRSCLKGSYHWYVGKECLDICLLKPARTWAPYATDYAQGSEQVLVGDEGGPLEVGNLSVQNGTSYFALASIQAGRTD